MEKIGYARVSTEEQNEARQVKAFEEQGVDKIFLDKMSGKSSNRPQLKAMLEYVREGDVVVVTELARLARSTADMFKIVDKLTEKGIKIYRTDKDGTIVIISDGKEWNVVED